MILDDVTLDPTDWRDFRALAREITDDTVSDLKDLPKRHGWRPLGEVDKEPFLTPLPREGRGVRAAYGDFVRFAKPFAFGQHTPRFWGWAGGAGTADGVLASLLNAAFHSPNIIHHHLNHRSRRSDFDALVDAAEAIGEELQRGSLRRDPP